MKTVLIIHHSDDPSPGLQFQSINGYHKRKGFPKSLLGFYVGYQYVVEKNGQVVQARTEEERGSHTVADYPGYGDLNAIGIGVCFAADFTRQELTPEQRESGSALLLDIMRRHGIPLSKVLLHKNVSDTSCPGRLLVSTLLANTKPKDLQQELKKAEDALRYASFHRAKLLNRKIARLKELIAVS